MCKFFKSSQNQFSKVEVLDSNSSKRDSIIPPDLNQNLISFDISEDVLKIHLKK